MALVFFALSYFFGGTFDYLNFVDRAQTYLPLAAIGIAALLGFLDDLAGVFRIGPNGED